MCSNDNNFIGPAMFSNKKYGHNRSSRISGASTNHPRSCTPQHDNSQRAPRVSQSQSKPIHPPQNPVIMGNLAPIAEQSVIEKPYYLGRGNNHEVIKRVLERRKGWGQVSSNYDFVCFRWVQSCYNFKFHQLGKQCICLNHFEYHRELSNKQRLVQNLVNFCEANKINVYSFLPVSFIIDLNTGQEDLALHAFIKFFNRNYPDDSNSRRYQTIILPRNKYIPYLTAQQLNRRSQGNFYCKPFFPKSFLDHDTKSYLWILKPTFLNRGRGVVLFRELDELQKLIWKYYDGEGLQDFSDKYYSVPKVEEPQNLMEKSQIKDEVIENKINGSIEKDQNQKQEEKSPEKFDHQKQPQQNGQRKGQLKKQEEKIEKKEPVKLPQIKPPALQKMQSSKSENTQTHISSVKKIEEQPHSAGLGSSSPTKQQGQVSRCMSYIIQKYIERPMLIEGKKFDIRVWALLTHNLEVFVFEEAYLRFSSQLYSTKDNHQNPFIHLTNNSVQKYSDKFDKNSGNQESLSSIHGYLPPNKADHIYKSIISKIKEIVWLSMCAARRKININQRKECFELFGYDFMIDYDYKVWLIEVNTNPAIQQASPLLSQLIPRMIDDMFKLTIDKIFNNKMKEEGLENLSVSGVEDDHNMWQFLGDLREGANERNGRRLTFARR